jgi:N-acetylmuramoyl-L-alanine amidase
MVRSAFSAIALCLSFHAPSWAQENVILDPGHGGTETGTLKEGSAEKDLALAVANEVESLLKERGGSVILTRRGDHLLSTDERRRIANGNAPGLFISLHFGTRPKIYVLPASGKTESGLLLPITQAHDRHSSQSVRLGSALVEALQPSYPDVGLFNAPFPLVSLVGISLPAVLLELSFPKTLDETKSIATHIVEGIDRFLSEGKNPAP